jgi:outer membrane protein TolC
MRRGSTRRYSAAILTGLLVLAFAAARCNAQVSFRDAIRLAVRTSPRVKAAENDLAKAQAGVSVVKDIYIPSVMVGGGAGYAYGITLSVPTIFTINTQSLVFSFQQRDYLRAAHSDLQAAKLALDEIKQQVEEDAAITYLSLDAAQNTAEGLDEQYAVATKLAAIMQDRLRAHLESELEIKKYQRGAIQIKLARMQADDNAEDLRGHLSQLTGIPPDELNIMPETIPQISAASLPVNGAGQKFPDTPGIRAAAESDNAKAMRAKGDTQYTWRPQIGFGANYGRVSPIENVSEFYNLHGIYNTYSIGVSVQFPILDLVRKAAAKQSRLDAERSQMDFDSLRSDEIAGRHKLQRSLPELTTKAELADLDYDIAKDELQGVDAESQHDTGAPPITPKEVENARIQERQKYVEMLDAKLQARKAQITFLRLTGRLDTWLSSLSDVSAAPK